MEQILLFTQMDMYFIRRGKRRLFFLCMHASAYGYESVTGQQKIFRSDFFDNENWYVRLLMEASDLMERNQEKILSNHNVCSYHPFSEEWKELKDQEQDVLERLVEREMFRDLMSVLTEKQKKAVTLYYLENMKQEDVCAEMGIAQQSVSNMIKRAVSAMKSIWKKQKIKKFDIRRCKKGCFPFYM